MIFHEFLKFSNFSDLAQQTKIKKLGLIKVCVFTIMLCDK